MAAIAPRVWDPEDPGQRANPYPHLHALRSADPVHRHRLGWILTRYDDVDAVLRSRDFGHDRQRYLARMGAAYGAGPAFDYVTGRLAALVPPEHPRIRGLIRRNFTPRRIDALRPFLLGIVDAVLDASDQSGEFDFIADLAHPVPSLVISELLGVPENQRQAFDAWTESLARLVGPGLPADELARANAAATAERAVVEQLIRDRLRAPKSDLLSALVASLEQPDGISEDELVDLVMFLFSAGHQTTRDLLGNGLVGLFAHPDQLRLLADDPSRAPEFVEECLRYDSPVVTTRRTATVDTEIGGRAIGAGEEVHSILIAANRDPERFPDPDRFLAGREGPHALSFGGGAHYCLGASLARTEATILLERLFERYPRLQLQQREIEWRTDFAFRGPLALRVKLRP